MLKKLFILLLAPCLLSAIDYSPWFDRILDFDLKANAWAQWGRHRADLYRNEFSLKVTPWTNLRAEAEIDFFSSDRYSYSLEAPKVSGQYSLLNDVAGDPVSLSTALTVMLPTARAKREYALFTLALSYMSGMWLSVKSALSTPFGEPHGLTVTGRILPTVWPIESPLGGAPGGRLTGTCFNGGKPPFISKP